MMTPTSKETIRDIDSKSVGESTSAMMLIIMQIISSSIAACINLKIMFEILCIIVNICISDRPLIIGRVSFSEILLTSQHLLIMSAMNKMKKMSMNGPKLISIDVLW